MNDPNANRAGYNETKAGWIPDDWRFVQLGECGEFKNGINKGKDAFGHGSPLVNIEDIFGRTSLTSPPGGLVASSADEKRAYDLTDGDVLFVRSSVKPQGVGLTAVVEVDLPETTYSGFIIRFRQREHIFATSYCRHCFHAPRFRKELLRRSTISANTNINQDALVKIPTPVPPLEEQQKIAEILSIWDEAIVTTGDLIVAKQQQQKALMQQLLTGKKRLPGFEGEWEDVVVGDLVEPISIPIAKPDKPYVAIGIRSHGKGTFQRNVDYPEKVAMDTLFRVEPGDLIVNITFAWEGAIAVVQERDAIGFVSHRFPTFRPKSGAEIGFLQYLVVSQRFFWDLRLVSPGGAGRNRVLNKKDFLRIKLFVPSYDEQKAVANVLKTIDAEITCLEDKRDALMQQKKALMQKLLTGQIRVKV